MKLFSLSNCFILILYSTYHNEGKQEALPQRKTIAEKEPRHLLGKFRQASNNEDDENPFSSLHIRSMTAPNLFESKPSYSVVKAFEVEKIGAKKRKTSKKEGWSSSMDRRCMLDVFFSVVSFICSSRRRGGFWWRSWYLTTWLIIIIHNSNKWLLL